jgi:propanediol dehydratase small subunit
LWAGLELTVSFARGTDAELVLSGLGEEHPTMTLVRPSQTPARKTLDSIRLDQILELAVKFEDLGVKPDDETEFAVEVSREGATIQRAPENTVIALKVPTPDFERQMWQV